ncbi:MAG: hypothetical protein ACKVXR_18825 [Planctomycetota bacterium]
MISDVQEGARQESRSTLTVVGIVALALLIPGWFLSMGLVLLDGFADVRRAYPSPELHVGVQELALSAPRTKGESAEVSRDFDGDGVADELSNEYFHMEPLFERATSGMVRVRSGATSELLLAHAVPTPFTPCSWFGDVDGNGTEDVLVQEMQRTVVLGHQGRR